MFDRTRRLRLLVALLIMASITIVTIDYRTRGDGPLDAVGRGAMTVLGPIQEGLGKIARPIGNFFSGFGKVGSLNDRIAKLEQENATFRAERQQVGDIERENDALRKLVGLKERFGLRTMPAQVVGVGPSNFERTVFIDRGSDDGVRKDMPVIGGEGLAGRVIAVGPSTAEVALITDRRSAVAARVAGTGETGVLDGTGSGTLTLNLFDPDARVKTGDQVVTSGYDQGLYPRGIPIGSVLEAPKARGKLSRTVSVQPFVDFSRLDHLLVVLGQRKGRRT